jgi:uncharacterized protein YodC (DUF2158 family)
MTENQFNLGDVVKLKSGGPWMTVSSSDSGWIICVWYEDGEIRKTPNLPSEALKKYERE